MTKRYTVLQKKLRELELELGQAFSQPSPGSVFKVQNNQIYSEDVEQRVSFLKSLLSAEITSSPRRPHHLDHIGKRLSELEAAFRDWDQVRSTGHNNNVDFPADGEEEQRYYYFNNGGHNKGTNCDTCSCTESFLNDDGGSVSVEEDLLGDDVEDDDGFGPEAKEKESLVRVYGVNCYEKLLEGEFDGDHGINYKENNGNNKNRFYEGLVGGVVIGVGLMGLVMLKFCACCYSSDVDLYSMYVLLPT